MVRFAGLSSGAWIAASLVLGGLGQPGRARAFSEPLTYFDDPANGGGGGRWFTGSPAEGYGCSVCHTGAPGQPTYPFYVEGLPANGYVAGTAYDIRLAWPEFGAHAHDLRAVMGTPAVSVVAEFVAENGTASGTLDIDPKHPTADEVCELAAGVPGMKLYSVRPAVSLAEGTSEVTHCDANKLGTRCLLAVRSCGVREVRARWTAPPTWQGPIWFAAGFVATDQISGNPEGDSVNEVVRPLMPATSGAARYEALLHNGCSVTDLTVPTTTTAWPAALSLGFAWLVRHRVRRRREALARGTL
jgi:hypothetical protein